MIVNTHNISTVQAIQISRIQAGDHQAVSDIYQSSIAANPNGFIQDIDFHGDICQLATDFLTHGGEMLVAKLGSKIVGFGGLKPLNTQHAELCKLHVDQQYQGLGIGKALVKTLISQASENGFSEIELHVTTSQVAAIKLYERLGFKKTKQEIYAIQLNDNTCFFDTLFMLLPANNMLTAHKSHR